MKNFPLGLKIGLGFALVLALTIQLGLWAASRMSDARDIVSEIALESTPEVELASNIEKLTLFAMYDYRGYGMSEEKKFLETGRATWKELKERFKAAEELVAKYPRLTGLKAGVAEAKAKVAEYDVVLDATVAAIDGLASARVKLEAAGEKYLRNASEYYNSMQLAMENDIQEKAKAEALSERREKTDFAAKLMRVGMTLQQAANKAQAQRDPNIATEALGLFDSIDATVALLAPVTRQAQNIANLKEIEAASVEFKAALSDLAKNWRDLSSANVKRTQVGMAAIAAAKNVADASLQGIIKDAGGASENLEVANTRMPWAIAATVLFGACVAFFLYRLITRPVRQTMNFALAVADGDLTASLDVNQKDEIGRMASAVAAIRNSVRTAETEFGTMVAAIERGDLLRRGNSDGLKGAWAGLIQGVNGVADRFAGCLDLIPLPIMTMTVEQKVQYLNKAGLSLLGLKNADVVGRPCSSLFNADDCNTDRCACKRAIADAAPQEGETVVRMGDNDLHILYYGTPIIDSKGQVVGAFEVVTDQTRIKLAQAKMLEIADRATEVASQVSSAAEELSAQVEQASKGADIQRERAGETATAMEEMNGSVLEIARNASASATSAESAKRKAEEGRGQVAEVIRAIGQARKQSKELKGEMDGLGEQVKDIGRVLQVIEDIADQTNLLALNAAIEAARAGDAGRGFAVVADEVRKLAEKTMNATNEVGQTVTAIQRGAAQSAEGVESAVKRIEEATLLAGKSGSALKEIVDLAQDSADQVSSIATASEQQSATSEEINRSVEEVNRISSETAQAMIQSSQAVMELSRQAQALQGLIRELKAS